MATFNGGRFLRAQLESLARQTTLPLELVVTDDGSEDDTLGQIEDFAATAPFPVRLHKNSARLGYADNFLKAASFCRGTLIAFCDQDDVWLEQKLARMVRAFVADDVLLVVHSGAVVDEELRPAGWKFPDIGANSIAPLLHGGWRRGIPGFAMVFRSSLPLLHRRPRPMSAQDGAEPMIHDQWVCFLASTFGRMAYIREPLVLYRRHSETATHSAPNSVGIEVNRLLATASDDYLALARLNEHWASYLEKAAPTLDGSDHDRALDGAAVYRSRCQHLERRAELYLPDRSSVSRLRTLAILVARGAYGAHQLGGLGPRALAKDATVGLLGFRCRH